MPDGIPPTLTLIRTFAARGPDGPVTVSCYYGPRRPGLSQLARHFFLDDGTRLRWRGHGWLVDDAGRRYAEE